MLCILLRIAAMLALDDRIKIIYQTLNKVYNCKIKGLYSIAHYVFLVLVYIFAFLLIQMLFYGTKYLEFAGVFKAFA